MANKNSRVYIVLLFLIPLIIPAIRLFAQQEGGNTIYLPLIRQTSTCSVPSNSHPTIKSALDDKCDIIILTASLYQENLKIEDHNVKIVGQGPDNTTIDGTDSDRVFQVEAGASLILEGVTVFNGYPLFGAGGGINNYGVTRLFNVVVEENDTPSDLGAGIHSYGTLTVENSWIRNNYTYPNSSGSRGGGVNIRGTAHFTNTVISGNTASDGGGLAVEGFQFDTEVTLVNTQILNNFAWSGGGIRVFDESALIIHNSLVQGNSSLNKGGGIINGGNLEIYDSQIVGNMTGVYIGNNACGGGIFNSASESASSDAGVLLIERSEIKDNYSISHGAGICNWNGYNDNPHGEVEIYNSLFSGNTAGEYGAGFYSVSDNTSIIENSTFQGNTAAANGGAISAYYLQMTNVTISQNSAPEGSGIYSWYDIAMVNSIIAGNTNSSQCSANTSAELTSQGHNISSDNSCDLNGPGDMPNTNPQLGPLQNNGGPTFTMALSAGSPAINTADNAACPPTDQRGVPRPQGPACDIGAYEYNG